MRWGPTIVGRFAATSACMWCLASALSAADYDQRQLGGEARLRLAGDRVENDLVEMALGLERTLSLTIEGPAPLTIQNESWVIEAESTAIGTIWDYKRKERREMLPGNQIRWQLTFQIDPRAEKGKKYPVEHSLQLIPITFQSG